MTFRLPDLPYAEDALEPVLSAETLATHHGVHHRGYVDKLNGMEERPPGMDSLEDIIRGSVTGRIFQMAAQAWNHDFYWRSMTPGGSEMDGELLAVVETTFGDVETLRERFVKAAAAQFGSGWAWLVSNGSGEDELDIVTTSNADTPLAHEQTPLLACDVWEHAYYIDYRADRGRYLEAWWSLIDWDFVARNLRARQREAAGAGQHR